MGYQRQSLNSQFACEAQLSHCCHTSPSVLPEYLTNFKSTLFTKQSGNLNFDTNLMQSSESLESLMFLPPLNFYNLLILFFSFQNGRQFVARLVLFNLILQESILIILNSLFVDSGNRDTQHLFFHVIFLQTNIY